MDWNEQSLDLEKDVDGSTVTLDLNLEIYNNYDYNFNSIMIEYRSGDFDHLVIQGADEDDEFIEYAGQVSDDYYHYAGGDPLNITYKGRFRGLNFFLDDNYGNTEDYSDNNFGRVVFDPSLDLGWINGSYPSPEEGPWEGVMFSNANAESFENYSNFVTRYSAFDLIGYIEGEGASLGKFLNYGTIQATHKEYAVYVGEDISLASIQVSPNAKFKASLGEGDGKTVVNRGYSFKWGVNDVRDARNGLEKIILAGKRSDRIRVGDADRMSVAILGWNDDNDRFNEAKDFPNLKTWQVGADQEGPYDDSKVVWEFGGEGGYADKDGITIDIVRGTARLTSDDGFGEYFDGGSSKVLLQENGTLDLYGNSVSIDNLDFEGGTLQNGKEDSSATLDSGFVIKNDMSVQADGPLEILGVIEGSGGFTKSGSGNIVEDNSYEGSTIVEDGQFWVEGSLPDETNVIVKKGSYYNVYSSDKVGSIEGEGSIEIATDAIDCWW